MTGCYLVGGGRRRGPPLHSYLLAPPPGLECKSSTTTTYADLTAPGDSTMASIARTFASVRDANVWRVYSPSYVARSGLRCQRTTLRARPPEAPSDLSWWALIA